VTAIYIATSNPGKLRDFAAAAKSSGQLLPLPGFASFASVEEDGATFAANARKKAEHYSRHAPHEDGLVLADDSGLEVFALQGEPGVRSARYSEQSGATPPESSPADDRLTTDLLNNDARNNDARNNLRLLRELQGIEPAGRNARFVCVLAAARQGSVLKTFRGELRGTILASPRGHGGFGYDPLFYVPSLGRTMAELSPEERSRIGHRGKAFKKFLQWLNRIDLANC
jgi:XTP/dITP diphosphohydrolase